MATWVVAADASRARVFVAEKRTGPLVEMQDLVHPESRLKEQELVSDSPGRGRMPRGGRGHSMGHEHDAVENEVDRFAREIAAVLARGRESKQFRRLHVLAGPRLLGLLRRHVDAQTLAMMTTHEAIVTGEDAAAIRARLPRQL